MKISDIFVLDFRLIRGGKYKKMLGFAHRKVAKKDKKSVIFRQLSLFIHIRKTMKKKQKSGEIAMYNFD